MADVFLSYQKSDRALAERMAAALKAEGFSVWWDDDVTPRESWDRTLEREIAAAENVLVLWTRHSIASDWVRIEGNYARGCTPSKLVQARFDDVAIPIAFSMTQYVDLADDFARDSQNWSKLLNWLRDGAEVSPARPPAPSPAPVAASSRTSIPAIGLDSAEVATFKYFAIGHILFVIGLMIGVKTGLAVYLFTPLFGLIWLWETGRRDSRSVLARAIVFLVLMTAIHYYAIALAQQVHGKGTEATLGPGAAGGAFGAVLTFMAAWLLGLFRPDTATLRRVSVGALTLTLVGALGVYTYIWLLAPSPSASSSPSSSSDPSDPVVGMIITISYMLPIFTPWQLALSYFLAKTLKPIGA